ncbi:response regulator [Zavarzinia compransoris]|uniref:response regulator transcription factor n=1 Tax=Zavarzinia marina TaxID=2911065 RepID=UPI001F1DA15B|nr:response regulator [Zavarzinia marina]MCF4165640.1 response regulator [Zavarzinia marina]
MTAGLVHIVDDDPAIRDALGFLLRSRGVRSTAWDDGAAFLDGAPAPEVACVILDVRMDGLSGLEVFDILRERGVDLPVIFLTGHADVPLAVEALKKGAFDFVEKPFNDNQLVDTVIAALERAAAARRHNRDRDLLAARMASLTPREREVLQCLVEGRLNKQIADHLGVSMRTVEVHRARVFEKMGVRNAVELVAQVGSLAPES